MREREWAERAACKNKPISWWYQPDDVNKLEWERTDRNQGRIVCAKCPVRGDCLNEAIRNDEPYGVWGGFDAAERSTIRGGRPMELLLGRCNLDGCENEFADPHVIAPGNMPKEYCSSACRSLASKRRLRDKARYDRAWRERQKQKAAEARTPALFDVPRQLAARVQRSQERRGEASA